MANPRIVLASPFQGDKEVLPNTAKRKANTAATKLDETANAKVTRTIRGFATFLRNIPTLVWAFILFSSLGIGTGVGFIALLISTFAFMTRAFIEVIDEVSCDAMEGLTACGGTFWQKVCQGIVPTCLTQFIAWFLYCIELNKRSCHKGKGRNQQSNKTNPGTNTQ